MAEGKVKIDITADDKDAKKKLNETKEGFEALEDSQRKNQTETEKTNKKYNELTESIKRQEKEVKELKSEYVQAAVNFGENSKEAQELKDKFAKLNNELTENKAKIKSAEDSLKDLGDEAKKPVNKFKELTETISRQETELAELKSEYTQAVVNFGKSSKEAEELKDKFSKLNAELKENKSRVKSAADGLEDLGDGSEKSGEGFDLAGAAAKGLAAGGMMAMVSAAGEALGSLMALSEETREYREDMAKLKTAFTATGHSVEDAQKAYDGFYKLLGESDRTVEAVNHLAELTTNSQELSQWQTIAAGVTAKFGDSLPIEGLTEAANETAKVGAVTGPLADALNWAGISEDAFNEKLKACNSEQERATLITSTLNAEYEAAAAEYNELTASTQAARDATNRMEQAQAELGEAVEPLATWWTNAKASLMEFAAETITRIGEVAQGNHLLTESENAIYDATMAAAEAYRAKKEAILETALAQSADVDYAANVLVPQLQAIVDANGQVKQGFEERANYLIGQMNEAWGTEYTNISQILGANGQLKDSIVEIINTKKAQILLEAHEEEYKNAVLNVAQAEEARAMMLQLVAAKQIKLTEAEEAEQAVIDEMNESIKKYGAAGALGYEERMNAASLAIEREEKDLNKLKAKFEEVDSAYQEYTEDIAVYDTAKTMMLEGNTEKAVSYLEQVNAGYGTQLGVVQSTDKELLDAANKRLTNAAVNYALLKDEYDKGEKSMTDAQKTQMEARIAAAEAEVESAYDEAKKLGSNLVEGIGVGADGKKNWLSGKLGGIVQAAIDAAKAVGIIKSPSRKTRDEVGIPLVQGIAVGIGKAAKEPLKAMESVVEKLIKTGKEKKSKLAEVGREIAVSMVEGIKNGDGGKFSGIGQTLGEIGQTFALGIAKGIEKTAKEPSKELKDVIDIIGAYLDEEAKKGIKTVAGYQEEIKELCQCHEDDLAKLEEEKNKELAELDKEYAENKKKKNEELAKLDKEHNKKIEALNEKHTEDIEKKNSDLTKYDEKYVEAKGKKNADLTKLDKEYAENVEKTNSDIVKLDEDHAKDVQELNEKLAEDKENKNEELAKLDEDYAKKREDIAKKYADKFTSLVDKTEGEIAKKYDDIRDLIASKMEELVNLGDTYTEEVKQLWDELDKSVTQLQTEYDNKLSERTKSIASSLGLWAEVKIESPRATQLTNNLKTQVRALERYNAAIENLEGRGLDAEFINQLKGLGVGSVGEIETLSRMSDERLQDYVELWEKKNKLAHDAALEELEPLKAETETKIEELTEAATKKYEEMRAKFEEQGNLLAADLKQSMIDSGLEGYDALIAQMDDYTSAGVGLMESVIEGIVQESPVLARVVAGAVKSAIDAAKMAAGYFFPSDTEMMSTLEDNVRGAVNDEAARMSQGVGSNNADTSAIADAVRLQTAGINSLASEFRRGSNTQVIVPLVLDKRELGRAIVELGNTENVRTGTDMSVE